MKNDEIRRGLGRELSEVRVSPDLRARILLNTSYRRRGMGFTRTAAAAAAAVVILGIIAGVGLARRPETPDNVTSRGSNIQPAATAAYTPAPSPAIEESIGIIIPGMWTNGEDGLFHLFEACASINGRNACISNISTESDIIPCPECFEDCVWFDRESGYFHEDFDCPGLTAPVPVNMSVLAHMDCEACPECGAFYPESESAIPDITAEPIDSDVHYEMMMPAATEEPIASAAVIGEKLALATPEPTRAPENEASLGEPTVIYHDALNKTSLTLSGWAAQNMYVNWSLTPGGRSMVFTGSALETDEGGEIIPDDDLEDADLDYCWCTENGRYIHSIGNCTNMKNSFVALITPAIGFSGNKDICPECGSGLGCVYYTKSGKHFHSEESCQGMKNTGSHTRRAAYAAGKTPCPVCLEYESLNPVE